MPTFSQAPVYNLNAVLRDTGLKADLLRAWERRYNLPQPQRSQGGHRLYSEYDIEVVKWLRARQIEGLSISRAVDLWHEIHFSGRDPLADYTQKKSQMPQLHAASDTRIATLRSDWLNACLNFDANKAESLLNQAFAIYPVETVCSEVLQAGLSSIGDDWYTGRVSVQQEHFTSALVVRRLETLISATPLPIRAETVLIACPPGEWHVFPALLFNLYLRRKGYKVIYLGADTPGDRLSEIASTLRPDLVLLAAQQLATAASLRSVVLSLQGNRIAYGGLIFNRIPRLREFIPAHYLGESIDGALGQIERLLSGQLPTLSGIDPNPVLRETARLYREKRARIELSVFESMEEEGLHPEVIQRSNLYFGNGLSAALELGDPAYLETDLLWVNDLLNGRRLSSEKMIPYLSAYSSSCRAELGSLAAPICGWMDTYIARNQLPSRSE